MSEETDETRFLDEAFVQYFVPVIREMRDTNKHKLLPSMNACLLIMDKALANWNTRAESQAEKDLNGLIMEVVNKHPDENRYETAKRYIHERENQPARSAQQATNPNKGE